MTTTLTHTAQDPYQQGLEAARAQDYSGAITALTEAARQDHLKAQCTLGFLLLQENNPCQDAVEGIRWLRTAAEHGSPEAHYNLAVLHSQGEHLPQDIAAAEAHYERAAEALPAAAHNLALLRFEHDPAAALALWRQAAEAQLPEAHYHLALCYAEGHATEVDTEQAIVHYQVAANLGLASAQYNLALYYFYGEGGLNEDRENARFWFGKAAAQGHTQAQAALAAPELNAELAH